MAPQADKISTDVLILGGGPAGTQAARLLRHHRPDWDITVLRPEDYSMVYCAIPYAIEGLFPLDKTYKRDELVTGVGAHLVRQAATELDPQTRCVTLADGSSITYDKLLVATGAQPVRPPLPGVDLGNIFTVKSGRDAMCIIDVLTCGNGCESEVVSCHEDGPKRAVVVGAGAIGIEQALAYRTHGIEVHLIEMQNHPLPQLIDEDMASEVTEQLVQAGVNLHLGVGLEAFFGTENVAGVKLTDGQTIQLDEGRDFVVLAIGMRPDLALLEGKGFAMEKDGLVVDEHMRTNVENVWAAGDCCQYVSGIDRAPIGGKLATNAVPMAKVAALDMLERQIEYPGFYNGAATVVGDLRVGGTGFTATLAKQRGFQTEVRYGESTTRFPMMPGAGKVKVKLVLEKNSLRVIGGQVIGTEAVAERIDVITLAIQQKLTALDLAEFSFSSQPWQTFFPAKNAIVEAAQKAAGIA